MDENTASFEHINVYFKPWIGPAYHRMSTKMLIVGDSHYCEESDECDSQGNCKNCSLITRKAVEAYMKYRRTGKKEDWAAWMTRTYFRFDKLFYGKENVSSEESLRLWNSISFYNFLQTAHSPTPSNQSYKTSEYRHSQPMAQEVIEKLRPDYIIVWGRRAYDHLPGTELRWQEGTDYYNGAYTLEDGHIVH